MSTTVSAAIAAMIIIRRRRQRRASRVGKLWSRQWLSGRKGQGGIQHFVVQELMPSDTAGFQSFLRMNREVYQNLLDLVRPALTKSDSFMRDSITADEKLILTLRFLSSGTVMFFYQFCRASVQFLQ